jgi:hypothetical protein
VSEAAEQLSAISAISVRAAAAVSEPNRNKVYHSMPLYRIAPQVS